MVTIKDIAREAGVSFTTVSNVIHGNYGHVSQATVQRVRAVMERMQYVPNMSARGLVSRSSRLIALAYGHDDRNERTMLEDAFASTLVGAIEREVRAKKYYLLLSAVQDPGDLVQLLNTWNVDGLLAFGLSPQGAQVLRRSTQKPLVFIDGVFLPGEEAQCINVGLEDRAAGAEMTEYLLARGHRQIAFCCGSSQDLETLGPTRERMLGWEAALHRAGIEPQADWRIALGETRQERRRQEQALLSRLEDFTALFVANDRLAAEVQNFLLDRGVQIPARLSIAGFDGSEYASLVRPSITTMRQDVREKGVLAVRQLLACMQSGTPEQRQIRLACHLVEGASTAQVPAVRV